MNLKSPQALTRISSGALAVLLFGVILIGTVIARPLENRPQLASRDSGRHGVPSDAASSGSIDGGGWRVAFVSSPLGGRRGGIFLRDVDRQRTWRLSDGASPMLSASGVSLAFDGDGQVHMLDLRTGARLLVSKEAADHKARGGNGSSRLGGISASGRFIAFSSDASDLLGHLKSARELEILHRGQIYVRDLKRRKTILVSRADGPSGAIGDQESRQPAISRNGRYVAFASDAGNLGSGVHSGETTIYVRDLRTDELRAVSRWGSAPAWSSRPSISAGGRLVAFERIRAGEWAVVVRDLKSHATVFPARFPAHPIQRPTEPILSSDGRFVAFRGGVEKGGLRKLFVADLLNRRVRMVHLVSGEGVNFSARGRFLVFDTYVQNVPGRESGEPVTESGEVYRLRNPLFR